MIEESFIGLVKKLDIPCCIIAGGQSRRFGSDKGLARLGALALVEITLSRLRAQTSAPIAINCETHSPLREFADGSIHDIAYSGNGPLSGLLAAMQWARSLDYPFILSVPVDTPFLPVNLIPRLYENGVPSISKSRDRAHFITGLWRAADSDQLEAMLEAGERSVSKWVQRCNAGECEFPIVQGVDPFFNINTPDDLKRAESALNQPHEQQ